MSAFATVTSFIFAAAIVSAGVAVRFPLLVLAIGCRA